MFYKIFRQCVIVFIFLFVIVSFSCSKNDDSQNSTMIAVFIPGIVSGSPVYEMLSKGVFAAVDDFNAQIKADDKNAQVVIIEAGSNQSEWSGKIYAISASGKYDVIITSNPSMPDIIDPITKKFPNQKYIILDANLAGNTQIETLLYNQREQAYLSGFISSLIASAPSSEMTFSNGQNKIALIAAQEYPSMTDILLPGFIEGAKAANPHVIVDFRIVGSWTDATKAAEISRLLYQSGTRVILPIAGGASQGVISAAKNLGFYIAWFDDNGFDKAPGYVISSAVMAQYQAAYESTLNYLNGTGAFGSAAVYGLADGYIDFIQDDDLYISTVSQSIRDKVSHVYQQIKSGELKLPIDHQ